VGFVGVVAKVTHRVGAPDRVGLAEQVVGEPDVPVRVGAAQLAQRGARSGAHLVLGDAEQARDVGIALPALEQQPEHRLLIRREGHGQGSVDPRPLGRRRCGVREAGTGITWSS
jgi:hypothetical protein